VPERFAALFEQAVARAIGPRRTGVFLSGGLDSVSVAVAAADLVRSRRGEPLLALSLAMPHPDCDEREVQAGVANGLGLEQRLIDFDDALAGEGLIERALELSAEWPAPLQNFWIAAYIGLARAGRDGGCRAILTGNGGDEWLGVSPFLAGDALRRLQLRRWYRLWRVYDRSYRVSRLRLLARHAWTFGMRPLVAAAFWSAVGAVSPKARASWRHRRRPLPPWLAPDPGLRRTLRERDRAAWEAADSKPREDAYVVHCREPIAHPLVTFELDEIAEHGRRAGVLFRQPYFDPDLVTFLARVRPEELMQGGRSKGLVRDEVARRCPDLGFRQQRKVLGTNLFEERMRREVEALWRQLGGPTTLAALEIVDGHKVEYLREGIRDGGSERRALYRLWSLLSAEVWVRSRVGE
jgi:asparagine synthetase B (glutamine-hydrolysing)